MNRMLSFLYIRAAEAGLILCILIVLFLFKPEPYWPGRPSGAKSLLAGAAWVLFLIYVLRGYFLTSAVAYFASGVVSSWKPLFVATASMVVFVVHSLGLISYSGIRMTFTLWLAWLLVVVLNWIMPMLVLQPGPRGVINGG